MFRSVNKYYDIKSKTCSFNKLRQNLSQLQFILLSTYFLYFTKKSFLFVSSHLKLSFTQLKITKRYFIYFFSLNMFDVLFDKIKLSINKFLEIVLELTKIKILFI